MSTRFLFFCWPFPSAGFHIIRFDRWHFFHQFCLSSLDYSTVIYNRLSSPLFLLTYYFTLVKNKRKRNRIHLYWLWQLWLTDICLFDDSTSNYLTMIDEIFKRKSKTERYWIKERKEDNMYYHAEEHLRRKNNEDEKGHSSYVLSTTLGTFLNYPCLTVVLCTN